MFRIENHNRPTPTPPAVDRSGWSDAAIAAEAASFALQEGRYNLGLAFARIAFDANRQSGPINVPMVAPAPIYDQTAQLAQTEVFGPQGEDARQLDVPRSARCIAAAPDGAECHAVLAWDAIGQRWNHLDPRNDTHEPIAPEQG